MGVIANDELENARRKLGLDRALATDPLANYSMTVLRTVTAHVEDALEEEGVDPEVARRILHRVLWGALPHPVDAQVRMDMMAERIDQVSRGINLGRGDTIPAWQTDEPIH